MVTLTEKAKDYLKSVSNGGYVSLGVKGGGCSGFQYVWDHANNCPEIEWSKPIDDVLVLDPLAELYIGDSTIDYVEELGGAFLYVII
jgi:Fe-S cluster assembly iron-binding protein IscA